jgi:hypothetical protein
MFKSTCNYLIACYNKKSINEFLSFKGNGVLRISGDVFLLIYLTVLATAPFGKSNQKAFCVFWAVLAIKHEERGLGLKSSFCNRKNFCKSKKQKERRA